MKKVLIIFISSVVLFSCNNQQDKKLSNETSHSEESHSNESDEPIVLNGSEKWVVNEEMKPFVSNGEELLSAYVKSGNSDHKSLASQLREQNNLLIQNCTMQGKSHDELHKWLLPHIKMTDDLMETSNQDEAGEIINMLQSSYNKYHQYFQ